MDDRLEMLLEEVRRFSSEREWQRFHDPKNLSMLIASEAGELMALFRWVDNQAADAFATDEGNREKIAAEIADVAISVLLMVDRMGLDLVAAVRHKLEVNRRNYPVESVRGRAERPPRTS
jgi:dCTP diphosphatase